METAGLTLPVDHPCGAEHEAVREFNRYNRVQMVISDEATGEIQIGGTFAVDNAEAFARLAESGLGLRAKRSGNTITFSAN